MTEFNALEKLEIAPELTEKRRKRAEKVKNEACQNCPICFIYYIGI